MRKIEGIELTLAILALACFLAASCEKHISSNSINYPDSWPIPALTVPPNSKQIKLPGLTPETKGLVCDGTLINQGTSAEQRVWEIAFQYQDENTLVKHIEAILGNEGFLRDSEKCQPGWKYSYYSPDGRQHVTLCYWDSIKTSHGITTGSWDGYTLQISHWNQPRPKFQMSELDPIQ